MKVSTSRLQPFQGICDAELMLLVALGGQRDVKAFSPLLAGDVVEKAAGDGLDGRGLEEVAVEAAEDPVQARNLDGGADARVDRGFVESGAVDGEALAAEQGDIASETQVVGKRRTRRGQRRVGGAV